MNAPKKVMNTGDRFGRLTLIRKDGLSADGSIKWLCRCDCGNEKTILAFRLRNGNTSSCGCFKRESSSERATKHGHSTSNELRTPTYNTWASMLKRCRDTKNPTYGGKGISVCERWHNFEGFLADMGERPDGMSIDRIDSNGNYEPSNCRWATEKKQQNNRSNNVTLTMNGETLTISEWCDKLGLSRVTVGNRIKLGWPVERVLSRKGCRDTA